MLLTGKVRNVGEEDRREEDASGSWEEDASGSWEADEHVGKHEGMRECTEDWRSCGSFAALRGPAA